MLSTFDFAKAKDENGEDVDIHMQCLNGIVRFVMLLNTLVIADLPPASHLAPFVCNIQPRDEKAVDLIECASRSSEA
jgi:hypothetical protein